MATHPSEQLRDVANIDPSEKRRYKRPKQDSKPALSRRVAVSYTGEHPPDPKYLKTQYTVQKIAVCPPESPPTLNPTQIPAQQSTSATNSSVTAISTTENNGFQRPPKRHCASPTKDSLHRNQRSQRPPSYTNKANWDTFRLHITAATPAHPIIESADDIDAAIATLTSTIQAAASVAIPTKVINTNRQPLPQRIIALIKHKRQIYREFTRTHDAGTKTTWNRLNAAVRCAVKAYREHTWNVACSSLNPRDGAAFWRKFKILTGQKTATNHNLTDGNKTVTSPADKAELFARLLEDIHQPLDAAPKYRARLATIQQDIRITLQTNPPALPEEGPLHLPAIAEQDLHSSTEDQPASKSMANTPIRSSSVLVFTACWASARTPLEAAQALQKQIVVLDAWMLQWRIQPNPSKTQLILFRHKNKRIYSQCQCSKVKNTTVHHNPAPAMDPQLDSNIAQLQSLPVLTRDQMTQLNSLLLTKLNLAIAEINNLRVENEENNEDKQQTIQCLLNNEESIATSDNEMDIASSQFPPIEEAHSDPNNTARNNKRKLNATTEPATNKRPLTTTSQQSGSNNIPNDAANSSPDSESTIVDQNPTSKKASKIPPIILRTKVNMLQILSELKNKGVTIKDAVNRTDCIKIHVESPKDFRQTTNHFDTNKIPYHTYHLAEEKLLKVVIRGIPEDINPKEVLEELQRLDYPAISATRMRSWPNRKAIPLILVQLTKPEGKDIFNLYKILYLRTRRNTTTAIHYNTTTHKPNPIQTPKHKPQLLPGCESVKRTLSTSRKCPNSTKPSQHPFKHSCYTSQTTNATHNSHSKRRKNSCPQLHNQPKMNNIPINNDTLRLAFFNANGINRQKQELTEFINQYNLDVIFINETHLKAGDRLKLANFTVYRHDRQHGPGGGTAIIVKRQLTHYETHVQQLTNLEATSIEIQTPNTRPLRLISVYNPPDKDILSSDLDHILDGTTPTIVAGDLNAKHRNWNCRVGNKRGRALNQYVNNHNLQVIAPPEYTHYTYNGNLPGILDIAIFQEIEHTHTIRAILELNSDHNPVMLNLHFSCHTEALITHRVLWKNFSEQIDKTITIPHNINTIDSLEAEVNTLTNTILKAISDSKYPIKARTDSTQISLYIRALIRAKNGTRHAWQQYRDPADKRKLNQETEQIRKALNQHRNDSWQDKILSLSTTDNTLWKMSKTLRNTHHHISPIHSASGIIFRPSQKFEAFADSLEQQFSPTYDRADLDHIELVHRRIRRKLNEPTTDALQHATPLEVKTILKRLNSKKAPGPDGIINHALKLLTRNGILALTNIINAAQRLHHFPKQWKLADVISIHKAGKKPAFATNYRPISLLSSIAKTSNTDSALTQQPHTNYYESQNLLQLASININQQLPSS
ncbi:hypothetical protein CBL_05154 [Carabus blaptoides fortunei]